MKSDIQVLPEFGIVYDPDQREYYNTRTDMFLSDDDIAYYHLTSPLPTPTPENYFVTKD